MDWLKDLFIDEAKPALDRHSTSGGGVTINNQDKTITENGEYTADSGYTGLGVVTVNVAAPGGGDDALLQSILYRSITEFSDSKVTKLGASAFRGANALKSVNCQSVKTVGDYAFTECAALETVSFPSATKVGSYAFQKCTKLTYANIPSVTSNKGMGNMCFDGCTELVEINAPSLTDVGHTAFRNCTKLNKITFGNILRIQNNGFMNCAALTEISFPNATDVCGTAFSGCTQLKKIYLPSVTKIGSGAFKDCSALAELDLGTYLQTATKLEQQVFEGCVLLEEVDLPAYTGVVYTGLFKNCTSLKKVSFSNPGITTNGNWGACTFGRADIFANCTSLEALIIRGTGVWTLEVTTAFTGSGIESGIGYIYVPAARVEEYKIATNWAVHADRFRPLEEFTVDGTLTGELDWEKVEAANAA